MRGNFLVYSLEELSEVQGEIWKGIEFVVVDKSTLMDSLLST